MEKKFFLKTVMSFILLLLFSCTQEAETTNMTILLSSGSRKTISADEALTSVTKYTVWGTGPGGKIFCVDSSSSTVTLENISTGKWTINASAYNAKGKELSSGTKEIDFTSDTGPISLELVNNDKNGSLQLRFEWDSYLSDVKIEINIIDSERNAVLTDQIIKVSDTVSNTTWSAPNQLKSGTYLLIAKLYSADYPVTGIAEAIIISPTEKTNCNFLFTKDNSWDSLLKKNTGFVTLKFSGLSETINSNSNCTITVYSDSNIDSKNMELMWYLDGEKIEKIENFSNNESKITINTSAGIHVISAVLRNNLSGEYTSVSEKFKAVIDGKDGFAALITNVYPSENGQLLLGQNQLIAPAGADVFISAKPGNGIIQLFTIKDGIIKILDTVKTTDSNWEWLSDLNGLWGNNEVSFIVAADNYKNLNVLHVNLDNKLEYALCGAKQERLENKIDFPNVIFNGLGLCSVVSSKDGGGTILVSPQLFNRALLEKFDSTGIVSRCGVDKPDSLTELSFFEGTENLVVCAKENSDELWYLPVDGDIPIGLWKQVKLPFQNMLFAKFLTKNMLILSDGSKLFFTVYRSKTWTDQKTISLSSYDIQTIPRGPYFYVLEKPDLVSSYMANGTIIARLGSQKLSFNASYLVAGKNYLLAVSDEGKIAVLNIMEK